MAALVSRTPNAPAGAELATSRVTSAMRDHLRSLASDIHAHLLAELPDDADERRERLADDALAVLIRTYAPLCTAAEHDELAAMLHELLHGFGVLAPLLARDDVSEIMINGPGPVWIERNGRLEPSELIVDAEMVDAVVDRLVSNLGLRLDRLVPWADARLHDGSRVHIAIPPMVVDGSCVTIRRHRPLPFSLSDFATPAVADLLRQAVIDRRTVLVVGGTGSGKTSLLNALAAHLPVRSRIITIEDAAELRLGGEHVVRLEARPANSEGVGEITIRTLVRNALRMRPDRVIVGEVRGGEAFDLVQALNTGHSGSLSTLHANGPIDGLRRLVALTMLASVGLSSEFMVEQVRSAVDMIVAVARRPNGTRGIEAVVEVGRTAEQDRWCVRAGKVVAGRPLRAPECCDG